MAGKQKLRLQPFTPKSDAQSAILERWSSTTHLALQGPAGTGKSYLALYLALFDLQCERTDRVTIIRSIVPTREIGFLPGDLREKTYPYEEPYQDMVDQLYGQPTAYEHLIHIEKLAFLTTSFLRSLTWCGVTIIIDEAQNMTWHELNSLMTRAGEGTRFIVCADPRQQDIADSGWEKFASIARQSDYFATIALNYEAIVRSKFVKDWVRLVEGCSNAE